MNATYAKMNQYLKLVLHASEGPANKPYLAWVEGRDSSTWHLTEKLAQAAAEARSARAGRPVHSMVVGPNSDMREIVRQLQEIFG